MAIKQFGMLDLLILAFTVILAKSQQDIISGVSKLDNLLLVSIFQRKKIRDDSSRGSSALRLASGTSGGSGQRSQY